MKIQRVVECAEGRPERVPPSALWHRLLQRSASESGALCHGTGPTDGASRKQLRRRVVDRKRACKLGSSICHRDCHPRRATRRYWPQHGVTATVCLRYRN
jgi:hypothetical protein